MNTTASVTYKGIDLDCTFTYAPGDPGCRYDSNMTGTPPSPPEFDDLEVFVNGANISELISDEDYEEILEEIINT